MKIWKLDSFVLHLKQIFPLLAFCCLDYQRRKGGDTIALITPVCFEITVKRVVFFFARASYANTSLYRVYNG